MLGIITKNCTRIQQIQNGQNQHSQNQNGQGQNGQSQNGQNTGNQTGNTTNKPNRTDHFVDLDQYPDEVTYRIVGAASEVLGMPASQLLREFGRHWILFTGHPAYSDLFDRSDSFYEFLVDLDALHAAVAESMPKLVPPNFGVELVENGWIVQYVSERLGLEPMVTGLLEGLLELFAVDGTVKRIAPSEHGETQFLVSRATVI